MQFFVSFSNEEFILILYGLVQGVKYYSLQVRGLKKVVIGIQLYLFFYVLFMLFLCFSGRYKWQ